MILQMHSSNKFPCYIDLKIILLFFYNLQVDDFLELCPVIVWECTVCAHCIKIVLSNSKKGPNRFAIML